MKEKVRSLIVAICVGLCFVLSSCNDGADVTDEYEQWQSEIAAIDSYLTQAGISAIKDPSGVRMAITKLGTGLPAQITNTVDVDYVGRRFSDGVQFDQGNTKLLLSECIEGWQVALSKLPEGSEAVIYIPSIYGYGVNGEGSIPGNTTLEFSIKLNDVITSTSELQKIGSDTLAIDEYLQTKNIDAIRDSSGIRYIITTPSNGPTAFWYDKMEVNYSIKLLTDDTRTIVSTEQIPSDDFYSRPVDYIHGMKIGLQKLPVGTKATLYIPSVLGFGAEERSDNAGAVIPANSNIIVEVEVVNIE